MIPRLVFDKSHEDKHDIMRFYRENRPLCSIITHIGDDGFEELVDIRLEYCSEFGLNDLAVSYFIVGGLLSKQNPIYNIFDMSDENFMDILRRIKIIYHNFNSHKIKIEDKDSQCNVVNFLFDDKECTAIWRPKLKNFIGSFEKNGRFKMGILLKTDIDFEYHFGFTKIDEV